METITQTSGIEEVSTTSGSTAKLIREVRAQSRRRFSAEDKIRIVVDTHGQARGTCQTQALLDALRANSHSPTAKAVEFCPSGY